MSQLRSQSFPFQHALYAVKNLYKFKGCPTRKKIKERNSPTLGVQFSGCSLQAKSKNVIKE